MLAEGIRKKIIDNGRHLERTNRMADLSPFVQLNTAGIVIYYNDILSQYYEVATV